MDVCANLKKIIFLQVDRIVFSTSFKLTKNMLDVSENKIPMMKFKFCFLSEGPELLQVLIKNGDHKMPYFIPTLFFL